MHKVTIESAERTQLEALARATEDAKTAKRILVILALDAGYRVKDVAKLFLLDEDTVTKWRNKYLRRRLFTDWLRGQDSNRTILYHRRFRDSLYPSIVCTPVKIIITQVCYN